MIIKIVIMIITTMIKPDSYGLAEGLDTIDLTN